MREADAHHSPATWALLEGDIEALASGFDGELRALADPGLGLIVEGQLAAMGRSGWLRPACSEPEDLVP